MGLRVYFTDLKMLIFWWRGAFRYMGPNKYILSPGRIFMKRRNRPIVLLLQHCSVYSLPLVFSKLSQEDVA